MPVMALALITPCIVSLTNSLEIGITSAIFSASSSCSSSARGPRTKPRIEVTARKRGNIEKSVKKEIAPAI